MRTWTAFKTALLTVAVASSTILAPGAITAQDMGSEPAYDYSEIEFMNPAAITNMAGTPEAAATPDATMPSHGALLGSPDAPVTLQIYADYLCPHCRVFHQEVEPQLVDDYVRPGKLRLEFMDFPVIGIKTLDDLTDDTKESVQAVEASICAAEQDAYMPYRDALYASEPSLDSGALSDDNLINIADNLDLDTEAFTNCLSSGRYEDVIVANSTAALQQGVQGTPTMMIDGEIIPMTQEGYEGLTSTIDAAIEKAQ